MFSALIARTGQIMQQMICSRSFHAIPSAISNTVAPIAPQPNCWSLSFFRTTVKNNFPRPSERKRMKVHGWRAMLSTKNGRRTIMRRILKGRYYLTH